MHEEVKLIVQAIESLKTESNVFKDYIFPIASAFFSSLLGAGIAYFFFRYQEKIKIEKNKMDIVNKWILLAEDAHLNLIAIKQNYQGKLTDLPLQRALTIPHIIFSPQPILEKYSELSFLAPKNKIQETEKWCNISRIKVMINNYNLLQDLWKKRNEIVRPIQEKLVAQYSNNSVINVTNEEIFVCVSKVDVLSLVDLTERTVNLTDDILIELEDFLTSFPNYAETLIDTKKIKDYGSVLKYLSNNNDPVIVEILKSSPKVNYQLLANLFGIKAEELEKRYKTGYEEI